MTVEEKTIARYLFQNKIYKADAQQFENMVSSIMNYADPGFQQIKPWGNIGDRKNDGYIKARGIYYQIYAPEDSQKSYSDCIKKLQEDFAGLLEYWSNTTPVKEFYFVLNDKYKGVNADAEMALTRIINVHHLRAGGFKTPKDLENILFSLADDEILTITGMIPDPAKIKSLNYSILNEVIDHINTLSLAEAVSSDIKFPDWDKKIKFNELSPQTASLLNSGSMLIASLDEYLNNQSAFFAQELRNKINAIYIAEKNNRVDSKTVGDDLFWRIVTEASPIMQHAYQSAVIVIMAKYFETCDILERPPEGK